MGEKGLGGSDEGTMGLIDISVKCSRGISIERFLYTIYNNDVPSFFVWIQNLDLGLD